MTLNEFLKKLEQTPREWDVTPGGYTALRCGDRCPIEVVADRQAGEYDQGCYDLGLRSDTAERIINAADYCGEVPLRARLLRACGL